MRVVFTGSLSFCSKRSQAVVVHALNSSTRDTEAGESLSSRPNWSTNQVIGQPGPHKGEKKLKRKSGLEMVSERDC